MSLEAKRVVVSLMIFTLLLFGWVYYSYGSAQLEEQVSLEEVSGNGLSGLVDRRIREWTEEILAEREMERMDALAPLPHEEKLIAIEEVEREMVEYITPEVGGEGTPHSFDGMTVEEVNLEMRMLHAKKMEWIFDQLEERTRRADLVNRINGYLHNCKSPMAGTGDAFYAEAAKYGIDPRLGVAIAEAESSCGKKCYNNPVGGCSYNAYGMIGSEYRGGFASWEDGIAAHFAYLNWHFGSPQTSYDCSGYCVPDYPWMDNVDRIRRNI